MTRDKKKNAVLKAKQEKIESMDEILFNRSDQNWSILQSIRSEWMVLTMAFQHKMLLQTMILRSSTQQASIPIIKININKDIISTIDH